MTSSLLLQDSGLSDSRLLARLVDAGTLVLDERDDVRFASPGACRLLGADDETGLRCAWPSLAAQLGIPHWPRTLADGEPFHGRADVTTPRGARALRYELHVVEGVASRHRALLVRDRAHLAATDRALLLASEAEANRHVLTGLVHAAKGPLNNFNLTLALLAANAARGDAPGVAAKRARYLEVLQSEAARLAACVDEIHALTVTHEPAPATIDVAALSRDCVRVLRHGATMREVTLDVDAPEHAVNAIGDPPLVRLALLSFAISVLDLTSPGGRVGWQVLQTVQGDGVRVSLTTSQSALPPALARSLFRLSCTAESPYSAAIAARLIVEAQGGDVLVHAHNKALPGILLTLPSA